MSAFVLNGKSSHFITNLPKTLEIQGQTLVKLEGLHVRPWPTLEPMLITCNICLLQVFGKDYKRTLSLVSRNNHSKPSLPAQQGRFDYLEVQVFNIDGTEPDIDSITVQNFAL